MVSRASCNCYTEYVLGDGVAFIRKILLVCIDLYGLFVIEFFVDLVQKDFLRLFSGEP